MTSRQPKKRSIKDFIKDIPSDDEKLEILVSLTEASDESAVLIGCTILERAITDAIAKHFRENLSPEELDKIFSDEQNGPITTLADKCRIAYALGIFGEVTRRDFDRIRHIRNAFAHPPRHVNFKTVEIKDECEKIEFFALRNISQGELTVAPAKYLYLLALMLYYNALRIYAPEYQLKGLDDWLKGRLP